MKGIFSYTCWEEEVSVKFIRYIYYIYFDIKATQSITKKQNNNHKDKKGMIFQLLYNSSCIFIHIIAMLHVYV